LYPKWSLIDTSKSWITMLSSRLQMAKNLSNSTLIKNQKLSNVCKTLVTHLLCRAMEEIETSDGKEQTLLIGNSSDLTEAILSMLKTTKHLMLKEEKILKPRMCSCGTNIKVLIRNGRLCMLIQ
jgi:hypothetical protein